MSWRLIEKVNVNDESDLQALLERWKIHFSKGDWIDLRGELGAGKTTLVRYLLKAWDFSEKVLSPTYPILQEYELKDFSVIHIDAYRLKGLFPEDWKEWGDSVVLIEWFENSGLPEDRLRWRVEIENHSESNHRTIALLQRAS